MRDAISEAGLPLDCKPHGLRKAAGRLPAEAGATAKMIMSMLGHATFAEAERYTDEADQAGLAEDAVIKLEGHRANRIAQTTSVGLGKPPKKRKFKVKGWCWRSLGESNPCFSLERAKSIHLMIIAKRVLRCRHFHFVTSLPERLTSGRLVRSCADHIVESGPFDRLAKTPFEKPF